MKNKSAFDTLDNVQPQEVDWLFKPFIPYGMLSCVEGDPSVGKSFLVTWLASAISTGAKFPTGDKARKGHILYLSAEDDPGYTIRPRIDALGGDPAKIHYMKSDVLLDDDGFSQLERACNVFDVEAVIFDPLISFTPAGKDYHSSTDIRALLWRLKRFAADYDVAVIFIRHATKGKREKAIHQGQGTIDIIAAVRSAMMIAPDPDDPDIRVFAHFKHNLSAQGQSYAFRREHKDEQSPTLRWIGPTNWTADDLHVRDGGSQKVGNIALDTIERLLADGPMKATDVFAEIKRLNVSDRTRDRAKAELGVKTTKKGNEWWWSLPATKNAKSAA